MSFDDAEAATKLVTVRVPTADAEAFDRIAAASYRSRSAELRRVIHELVALNDEAAGATTPTASQIPAGQGPRNAEKQLYPR